MSRAALSRMALAAALCALAVGVYLWHRPRVDDATPMSLGAVLGDAPQGIFEPVLGPRPLRFPADHGPHPRQRLEWWYVTGNVATAAGRRFGYQLTFFRFALSGAKPRVDSAWATDQTFMAHLALTDVGQGSFRHWERFSRGAAGLAGARAEPLRVWLDGWSLEGDALDVCAGCLALRLTGADGDVALDLELASVKPYVMHGDRGYSRKNDTEGGASLYYSLTRLATRGRIVIGSEQHTVNGWSWLDREWSTSALAPNQVGWDWFALQLDDGREIMWYRLRRDDGSTDPLSSGTIVYADGSYDRLLPEEVDIAESRRWASANGVSYPVAWQVRLPAHGMDLRLEAWLDHQEINATFRYWEGAVRIADATGQAIGSGYVELTGY